MSNNGQKIEHQMRQLRQDLAQDGQQLAQSTERLKDWREYVRAFPWLSVAGAAAVGVMLAPAKSKASGKPEKEEDVATAAAGGTLLGFVGATVGRAAATFATKYLMNQMNSDSDSDRSPNPQQTPWKTEATNNE